MPQDQVLKKGECSIGDEFVSGHPLCDGVLGKDPRPEDEVVLAVGDHRGERRHEEGGILIIRVQHHDDVGPELECRCVAALLVRPVTPVAVVADGLQTEP